MRRLQGSLFWERELEALSMRSLSLGMAQATPLLEMNDLGRVVGIGP